MAKAKTGAKKTSPGSSKKESAEKPGLLKGASKQVKAAVKLVKSALKGGAKAKSAAPASKEKTKDVPAKAAPAPAAGPAKKAPAAPAAKAPASAKAPATVTAPASAPAKGAAAKAPAGKTPAGKAPAPVVKEAPVKGAAGKKGARPAEDAGPGLGGVSPEKPRPRATKLPPAGQPLTKREMEQLLTAGAGRGVVGEGSLKGRMVVKDEFPYLLVTGRDKRELSFLLQGPDQEVLPAYVDHKVSVSGLIKKTTNYGGTVDVRKYSAKKPEAEAPAEAASEPKLRYLSPGEVEQISTSGMGAGMKGFATLRGNLEMTGDEFFLVLSNGGTRQQVSFLLEGKNAKGLRKHVGHTLLVTGVADKASGWGGKVEVENFEPRPSEFKAVARENLEVASVEGAPPEVPVEVKLNHGLSIRLQERAGFTWAIEPTVAKRVGLREANFEPASAGGTATREFFFTPRNPGTFDVEFFLAKVFTPAQVAKTYKLQVAVKP